MIKTHELSGDGHWDSTVALSMYTSLHPSTLSGCVLPRVLSRMSDVLLLRCDKHDEVEELAEHATVPVIK